MKDNILGLILALAVLCAGVGGLAATLVNITQAEQIAACVERIDALEALLEK